MKLSLKASWVYQMDLSSNMLTNAHDCDPMAKTPYHKNVRVKLEKVAMPV